MKRTLMFLSAVLVLAMAIPTSAAAKLVSFGSGASGNPGASVTVSINVDNLSEIAGYNIDFTYDSTVLTATGAAVGSAFAGYTLVPNIATAGQVRLGMIGIEGNPSTAAGQLATVTFTVKTTAYKNSALTFTRTDLKNESGQNIAGTTTANGSVAVTGVIITVAVTPASTTNVVAGQAQTLTAEVLVNGTHLDLTGVDDVLFTRTGSGTFGAKSLAAGKVQVPYTTSTTVQTATITATETVTGNNNTGSATVASIAGPLVTLTVSPNAPTLTADQTRQFTVAGVDVNGNAANMGTITWSGGAGIGTINAAGLFTATTVGTGTVTATSSLGPSDSSGTITVTAGALATLTVSPNAPTLTADQTQQFTVAGVDADDNPADMGTITWSGGAGIGTINATGLFTANIVGTGTVTATSSLGPTDSSGTITVTAGALATLTVNPNTATVVTGQTRQFTAAGVDANGNAANVGTITWSGGAGIGTINANTGLFTATTEGTGTVTATSSLGPTDSSGTISVVTFSATAQFTALVTSGTPHQTTITAVGGTNYTWSIVNGPGTLSAGSGDTATFTAPDSITGGLAGDPTVIRVADAGVQFDLTITTYNPVAVTWPTAAAGIATGDNTKRVTASGGTEIYKFQSSAPGVATVNADTGVITPVAVGTFTVEARDSTFGVFGTANGFRAVTPNIQIVAPIVIAGPTTVDSAGTGIYTFTGGTGAVNWTTNNGTINAAGQFTAPAVQSGSIAVKITATDKVYGDIKGEYLITVFGSLAILEKPAGYVDGQPTTYPLLAAGLPLALSAADASRNYDWVVTDWNGVQIVSQITGASTFTLDPDVLFAANGAGIYTVTLTDQDNPALAAATLNVRVPMRFVATKFAAGAVKDAGTYKTDVDTSDTYTVNGGPAGNVYTYAAYDLNGVAVNPAVYGAFEDPSPTNNDNVFNFDLGIDELLSYRVKVVLNRTAPVDAEVQRLIDAGLDSVFSGIFRIVPVVDYSGQVVELDGTTPIQGAMVVATNNGATTTTAVDGTFTLTGFDAIGVTYTFYVSKDGYVDRIVTGSEILAGPIKLEQLGVGSGTIGGTVALSDDVAPYESGTVSIKVKTADGSYVQDGSGADITALANPADGSYSFPVPANFAARGPFDVEFRKTGYIFDEAAGLGVLTNVALNAAAADITLNPVTIITVTGTAQDSANPGGTNYDQVLVKITAEAGLAPLMFDGTLGEIKVLDSAGNDLVSILHVFASDGPNTWSFVHPAYENFTITVYADVSETPRDVDAGYKATKAWTYVKSAEQTETIIPNPSVDGGQATSGSGDTDVNIPPGGLTGDVLGSVTVVIVEVNAGEAGATGITGSEIIDVTLVDGNGAEVNNANIARIEITLKFDPTVVTPGTLENGTFVIFQADTVADLIAGNATPVPTSQLILPIDYTNGFVTFWVDHLSAFGIGAAPAAQGGGGGGGGDSGCFIASVSGKTSPVSLVIGLLMLFLAAGAYYALMRRAV